MVLVGVPRHAIYVHIAPSLRPSEVVDFHCYWCSVVVVVATIKRKLVFSPSLSIRIKPSPVKMGSMPEEKIEYVDVLLVGAGFASFTLLNRLRKLGLSVRIYEKGAASGGIWCK